MPTSRPRSNYFAILFVAIAAASAATICNAFSVGPAASSRARIVALMTTPKTQLSMASDIDTDVAVSAKEEMVTMRSLNLVVESKPLGIILEEMGDGVGVFCEEVEIDGAAYAAGIRNGDVLAALNGEEAIQSSSLDGAMEMLGQAALPLPVKVYRELEPTETEATAATKGRGTVKMAPRRLPSTKKLIKASTNVKFWQDPLMIGSALLTVAMPLGIYIASSGGKGM